MGGARVIQDLLGQRAVVTGGASGIGLAAANLLARSGARVTILDLAAPPAGVQLDHLTCDVTNQDSVTSAVESASERGGGLDIVINSAGIGAIGTVLDNTDDEWHRLFDVNVLGVVRMMRASATHLRRSRSASVVNVCSIAATAGLPQRAAYTASKGALLALTRAMAADHLSEGIRVNAVNPGTAATPWVERLLNAADDPASARAALEARQPHGRLVTADEVAGAIAYLAGPGSASTTGTAIEVDGGMAALRLPPRLPQDPTA